MAYPYPQYYPGQQYPYQDQLSQLRSTPMMGQYPQAPRADSAGLNWVQGEAGAKSWMVAPGSTVLLMDSEAQRFYLKTADHTGIPNMRTFEYSEVGAAPAQAAPQAVTREEFDKLAQIVAQLQSKEVVDHA